jgi:sugar/nucleoside kinase (ribokinase family)
VGRILVVGNYCHDTVHTRRGTHRWAGGSSFFIGSVLSAIDADFDVIAKVGDDFAYEGAAARPASVVEGRRTTACVDDYREGARKEVFEALCAPIRPDDLPDSAEIALAVAVAGEILPDTFAEMRERCDVLMADAQGLLRAIDEKGRVRLLPLVETDFSETAHQLDYLKANEEEAAFLDIETLRRSVGVIVTRERRGCSIFYKDAQVDVPGYPVDAVDPTGAGDSFFAGFAFGVSKGWPIERALRLANLCGSAAVRAPGTPELSRADLEAI